MKFSVPIIRPAGNPVKLQPARFDFTQFQPFYVDFFHSGTAALAAAIIASAKRQPGPASTPEIILPAYGCPDLISAIHYAGAKPVLVDLEPDSPWMSLAQITSAITDNTIAILAIRFLGIPERMDELLGICKQHKLLLIEDSAQGFPITPPDTYWRGDFNILSFGRGKPINLLAGGAVLSRNPELRNLLPKPMLPDNSPRASTKYLVKASLYNMLLNPVPYGLVSRVPGLNIGETTYKPLHELRGMPEHVLQRLSTNIDAYKKYRNLACLIRNYLCDINTFIFVDLPATANYDFANPLLRYPLLIENKILRDSLYRALSSLGASVMYKQPLRKISGIPGELLSNSGDGQPNAQNFADRLLTLPTHLNVSDRILRHIKATITEIGKHPNV